MVSIHADSVRPDFDPRTETYVVAHDSGSTWDATTTLVLALSSLTGDDPAEMEPLGYVVDPDVLNGHVRSGNEDAQLSFEFQGYRMTVDGDGRMEFAPLQDADDDSASVRV